MRSVVRTGVNATGFGVVVTEIARRGLHAHTGDFPARMSRVVEFDRKRMQIDVPVWAVIRT